MTLDQLEQQGYIKKLPIDEKKVKDALALAQRDIETAKTLLHQDTDWAFSIAYNAILQTLRALMFSQGYRPDGDNDSKGNPYRCQAANKNQNNLAIFYREKMRKKDCTPQLEH